MIIVLQLTRYFVIVIYLDKQNIDRTDYHNIQYKGPFYVFYVFYVFYETIANGFVK